MALKRVGTAPIKKPEPTDGKFLEILYVEDEDTNWEVTRLSLADKFLLTRARRDLDAFEVLRERTFDVILMDIQLRGSVYDGIEITRIIKGRQEDIPEEALGLDCKKTPVIFVTAYSARYERSELMAAGGDELIPKPVDFARLTRAILDASLRRG